MKGGRGAGGDGETGERQEEEGPRVRDWGEARGRRLVVSESELGRKGGGLETVTKIYSE